MRALDEIDATARDVALEVFGAFHLEPADEAPAGTGTLILLGPHEPGFWPAFRASAEYRDGAADPLDRWSARVVGGLAERLDAAALYPFGTPRRPFIRWALHSGRAWPSPVGMLVHDRAGLMVSYRGALALEDRLALPAPPAAPPCDDCRAKPCLSACPVGALGTSYDLTACHAYLDTSDGTHCMNDGCAVRRSCPVSRSYGRMPGQSAFHMAAFHKE
ncbi:ferredoxin [Maritimibacter sp. 55A14]|uniref:ferredoxin n=1 Tax=Maritimibacter sp. 55A14 TaxID=2174844 RepID=UPI000D610FFA|nr:ferredoxin [Maritimibacter sp. 55A14]PWE32729.1 ferredoxin [Maritimibacter sp. 55A14]